MPSDEPTAAEIAGFKQSCYTGHEVWYDEQGRELPEGQIGVRGLPLYYEAEPQYANLIKRLLKYGIIRTTKMKPWDYPGYVLNY